MVLYREVSAGSGHLSQNSPIVAFGLGSEVTVDSLMIHWPSGMSEVVTNLATDRVYLLQEGANAAIEDSDVPEEERPNSEIDPTQPFRLHLCHPNPFNPGITIPFSISEPRRVTISIFDLTGRLRKVVVDRNYPLGTHSVYWGGTGTRGQALPSGTYLVKMETLERVETQKAQLIR
jgi:hypothetical protein